MTSNPLQSRNVEKRRNQELEPITTLILLQYTGELSLGCPLRLASFQTLRANLLLAVSSSVRVQSQKDLLVVQRVLLLDTSALGSCLALGGSDDGLDFGRVDQTADISLRHDVGGKEEVFLEGGWGCGGSVDGIQSLESGGSPDDEATEMSTWCKLEEVERKDGGCLNTGDVAESTTDLLAIDLGVVDNQRTTALTVAAPTELTLTSTKLAGLLDLLDIWGCAN